MGVMSDLSGKSNVEKVSVRDRSFSEIDVDNFDARLRSIKPRVAFQVDNVLTDEGGKLPVDIEFESMSDFSPGAIASKIDGVKELLEARTQLKNLMSYMDGKANAEEWLAEILKDETLLKSVLDTKQVNSDDTK
jgi:type VI secretion system protein ImpB